MRIWRIGLFYLTLGCAASFGLSYNGYFDTASCGNIGGWAWDGTNDRLNLDIYDGAVYVTTTVANIYRADLLDRGHRRRLSRVHHPLSIRADGQPDPRPVRPLRRNHHQPRHGRCSASLRRPATPITIARSGARPLTHLIKPTGPRTGASPAGICGA